MDLTKELKRPRTCETYLSWAKRRAIKAENFELGLHGLAKAVKILCWALEHHIEEGHEHDILYQARRSIKQKASK